MIGIRVILLLGVLFSLNVYSEPIVPSVVAVQKRTYNLTNELTLQGGYVPLDSFTRYFSAGVSFTHFFTDFWGWEVVNAHYTATIPSGLEQELKNKYGALPENEFDILNYYFSTNLVWTPLYMKSLFFDSSIAYGETSFTIGPVLSKFEKGNFIPGVNFGVLFRYLLGESTSLKVDIREHIYLRGDTKQNLMFIFGFAYNFGTPGPREEDPK